MKLNLNIPATHPVVVHKKQQARHRPSGTIVAVKVIPLSGEDEEGLEDIRREIAVLQAGLHSLHSRVSDSLHGLDWLSSTGVFFYHAPLGLHSLPGVRLVTWNILAVIS